MGSKIMPIFGYATKRWNPLTGCSAGCDYCWAKPMAVMNKGKFGYPADDPFRPTFHLDRLREPEKWRTRKWWPIILWGIGVTGDTF